VSKLSGDIADLSEQLKVKDSKLMMHQRKIDGLEEVLSEKEQQIEQLKTRLHTSPHVQQQKAMQDAIEEGIRDRERLQVCSVISFIISFIVNLFSASCRYNVIKLTLNACNRMKHTDMKCAI
jgi:hypothetical protein